MSKIGGWTLFWTSVAALVFPPLAPAVALVGLTAWAVSGGETESSNGKYAVPVSKEEFGNLTSDLPQEVQSEFYQWVMKGMEETCQKILDGKPGRVEVTRKDNMIIGKVYEKNGGGPHIVTFKLP